MGLEEKKWEFPTVSQLRKSLRKNGFILGKEICTEGIANIDNWLEVMRVSDADYIGQVKVIHPGNEEISEIYVIYGFEQFLDSTRINDALDFRNYLRQRGLSYKETPSSKKISNKLNELVKKEQDLLKRLSE